MIQLLAVFVAAALTSPRSSGAVPDSQMHHHEMAASANPEKTEEAVAKMTIPDIEVLDQNGHPLHFYRDLVKRKVVAINFIFTTCTTICPPMAATFSRIQTLMGRKIGGKAYLISISVDPVTDTPERLKAWSAKFGARPGWTLVTGDKTKIDTLLSDLGGLTAGKWDHSPTVLIGNDATNEWTRAYGLAPAARLVSLIEGMMKEPPAEGKEAKP